MAASLLVLAPLGVATAANAADGNPPPLGVASGGYGEITHLEAADTPQVQWGSIQIEAPAQCPGSGTGEWTTASFTASGLSTGTYAGTFHEVGTFTYVTPTLAGSEPRVQFQSTFTIDSPVGQVTGTKTAAPWGGQVGLCQSLRLNQGVNQEIALFTPVDFTATIRSGNTVCTQTGGATANLTLQRGPDEGGTHQVFAEQFGDFGEDPTKSFSCSQGADAVTLTPPNAVNPVGTMHTVTATATNGTAAVPGTSILFSVSGASAVAGSCTTDPTGQCSFTYQGPNLPGADLITACADNNKNGASDPGEPCAEATKAWVMPTSTPGQVTGGGQIPNATGNDKVAFGFNAKSANGKLNGNCTVVDPSATNTKVKCLNVTVLVQNGTHATLFGQAEVNNVPTDYRIDVDDVDEPGANRDTFKFTSAIGYTVGGVLTAGNVQTH